MLLIPTYRPIVQRVKPEVISVKQWSAETAQQLQACSECTDWNVFIDSTDDLNELIDTASSYVKFCEDLIKPSKQVECYSDHKPWITKDIKHIINKKKQIYSQGDKNRTQSRSERTRMCDQE